MRIVQGRAASSSLAVGKVRALALSFVLSAAALGVGCGDSGTEGGGDTDVFQPDIVPSECQYDQQCVGEVTTGTCEVARCVAGSCQAAPAPLWSPCDAPGVAECERGGCNPDGACIAITAENGTPCRETEWDTCTALQCQAGVCTERALLECDDQNACTDDNCDPAVGCVSTFNTGPCDDGNACTGGDVCAEGECVGDEDLCQCLVDADCAPFDDGNLCNGVLQCNTATKLCVPKPDSAVTCDPTGVGPCQQRTCVPATGLCAVTAGPDFVACDDGNPCTGCAPGEVCAQKDFCQAGVCKAGLGKPCACEADEDCVVFDDGDLCNGGWTCQDGLCAVAEGSEVDCSGQVAPVCQVLACDPDTGTCDALAAEDGEVCDDGDPCTGGETCVEGACVPAATDLCACTVDADCAGFDDGLVCNGVWTCQDDVCAFDAASVVDCSGEAVGACEVSVCSEETGACTTAPAEDGTACDDGDVCTGGDTCAAGVCAAGGEDLCACEADLDCAGFDDGDLCNGTWVCEVAGGETVGSCVADPTPVTCDDAGVCEAVACVPDTGACEVTALEGGEACDDGDGCTLGETCAAGGVCTPADEVSCEDPGACKTAACVPATGLCVTANVADATACDDGDACTEGDVCTAGACVPGAPRTCPDLGACQTNTCNTETGACEAGDAQDGTACDLGLACTSGDTCQDGTCTAGVALNCSCDVAADCAVLDDGDLCNGSWTCAINGKCVLNPLVSCDDCPGQIGCVP